MAPRGQGDSRPTAAACEPRSGSNTDRDPPPPLRRRALAPLGPPRHPLPRASAVDAYTEPSRSAPTGRLRTGPRRGRSTRSGSGIPPRISAACATSATRSAGALPSTPTATSATSSRSSPPGSLWVRPRTPSRPRRLRTSGERSEYWRGWRHDKGNDLLMLREITHEEARGGRR